MTRHTTFRYCLDPTVEQQVALARHAGAARFAFNQCLHLHLQARTNQRRAGAVVVPWTAFDLINLFNAWKKTEQAGRVIVVDDRGEATVEVTGLAWRASVCQQATWPEQHRNADVQVRDPHAGGPVTNAHRQERSGRHLRGVETDLEDVGTDVRTAPAARTEDAREGRRRHNLAEGCSTRFKVSGDDYPFFA